MYSVAIVTGIFGDDSIEKVATVSDLERDEVVRNLELFLSGEASAEETSETLLKSKVRQSVQQVQELGGGRLKYLVTVHGVIDKYYG